MAKRYVQQGQRQTFETSLDEVAKEAVGFKMWTISTAISAKLVKRFLRERNISERGSTVNSPYVNNTFVCTFFGTSREVEDGTNWGDK